MSSFEQYLRAELSKGQIDFTLRATPTADGVEFYIHPARGDGESPSFMAKGNALGPNPRCWTNAEAIAFRHACSCCDGTGRVHSHNDICEECDLSIQSVRKKFYAWRQTVWPK